MVNLSHQLKEAHSLIMHIWRPSPIARFLPLHYLVFGYTCLLSRCYFVKGISIRQSMRNWERRRRSIFGVDVNDPEGKSLVAEK